MDGNVIFLLCLALIDKRLPQDQTVPSHQEGDGLPVTRSSGLFALGWIQRRNSMLTEALDYFERSFRVAQSAGDEGGKAKALNAIGGVLYYEARILRS